MKGADGKRVPIWLNTRTLVSHLFFGPYVIFPILAALTWLGGILALLVLWVVAGKPRYKSDEGSVVFISDVGATHQTLFICICACVSGFYILSLFAERWLRHIDRLPTDLRRREHIFDWLAIFFGIVGSCGLILLASYNTFDHSTVHWCMTVVFIAGVAISAIFQSAEVWSLHKDHPDRRSLKRNSIIKLTVVVTAVVTAISFGATYAVCRGNSTAYKNRSAATCNRVTSAAASFEWAVSFILTFYFLTLAADLWPAGKSSPRYMRRLAKWQERHGDGDDFTGRRAFGMYPERWQDREAVMKQNMLDRNRGIPQAGTVAGEGYTNGVVENGDVSQGYANNGVASGGYTNGVSDGYGTTRGYGDGVVGNGYAAETATVDGRASMAGSEVPMVGQAPRV